MGYISCDPRESYFSFSWSSHLLSFNFVEKFRLLALVPGIDIAKKEEGREGELELLIDCISATRFNMRSSITFLSVAGAASIVLAQQTPAQLAAQIPDCVVCPPISHGGSADSPFRIFPHILTLHSDT